MGDVRGIAGESALPVPARHPIEELRFVVVGAYVVDCFVNTPRLPACWRDLSGLVGVLASFWAAAAVSAVNQLRDPWPRQVSLGNANYRWESQPHCSPVGTPQVSGTGLLMIVRTLQRGGGPQSL